MFKTSRLWSSSRTRRRRWWWILLLILIIYFSSLKVFAKKTVVNGRIIKTIPALPTYENSLTEDPVVSCGLTEMSMHVRTLRPYNGRIFVRGYSQHGDCQRQSDGTNDTLAISLQFGHCGLQRNREMNGVSILTTVIVSFHPIFITKFDRAYRLECFYKEAKKNVLQQSKANDLTLLTPSNSPTSLSCRYELLRQNHTGKPVKYAHTTGGHYHRWTCRADRPEFYCLRVHSCTVHDGQDGAPVYVLDERGCEVDNFVFRNLDYINDMEASQTASVFKFADKSSLCFKCKVEVTLKKPHTGCTLNRPRCTRSVEDFGGDTSVAQSQNISVASSTFRALPLSTHSPPSVFPPASISRPSPPSALPSAYAFPPGRLRQPSDDGFDLLGLDPGRIGLIGDEMDL